MFFRRTLRDLSPLIEALISIDRFLEVYYPFRFSLKNNKLFVLVLIMCSILFTYFLNILNMFYFVYSIYDKSGYLNSKICTSTKKILFIS